MSAPVDVPPERRKPRRRKRDPFEDLGFPSPHPEPPDPDCAMCQHAVKERAKCIAKHDASGVTDWNIVIRRHPDH